MPLANTASHIPVLLQQAGNGPYLRQPLGRIERLVIIPVVAKRRSVPPRQKSGTRGTAHIPGDINGSKTHAIGRQSIDMWRRNIFAAIAANIGIAPVVRHDDHDVGTVCCKQTIGNYQDDGCDLDSCH